MRALKLLMDLPFNSWTKEEQESLPDAINRLLEGNDLLLVLGHKRCFLCGIEIGEEPIPNLLAQRAVGARLVVNLCGMCALQAESSHWWGL